MRRTINNVISVIFSLVKFSVMKIFNWSGFIFSPIQRFSPNVVTEFNNGSKVKFEKGVRIHSGTKIKVRKDADLSIGANVKINYNCIIACHKHIEIGEGTEFGPSVYLYDHDHDYRVGLKENKFKSAPITIGKNCWIGANTIILNGTDIGDNCVIAAGSVVKGSIPANTLFVQKRVYEIKDIGEKNE